MKKKDGFTLSEVLITLGIVGVVAAMTVPRMVGNYSNAQIGPKLAKAVAAFEQANEALLNAHSVDTLSDGGLATTDETIYLTMLSQYLKGSFVKEQGTDGEITVFLSKDGIKYQVTMPTTETKNTLGYPSDRLGYVVIDLDNSSRILESAHGVDLFKFSFWNDGTLRPKGGTNWMGGADPDLTGVYKIDNGTAYNLAGSAIAPVDNLPKKDAYGQSEHWTQKCDKDREYCAGSIFENNLKVLYR